MLYGFLTDCFRNFANAFQFTLFFIGPSGWSSAAHRVGHRVVQFDLSVLLLLVF